MSEYMGLIYGAYDAKKAGGFVPGGASLHNCMVPHGPDQATYEKAMKDPCDMPTYYDQGMAFMFESCLPMKVTPQAMHDSSWRDDDYETCWEGLDCQFTDWSELEKAAAASDAL
jgi:homogentisate 1,2-dioxygenase